ncbi:nuclear transport factor 2 family protein [[Mycobacterium] kokjensenii]|uniref:Nuclear transport factor 2 family protein n=1 Tax=[Mycobacterium] kokjensenii TaxID=3064287 RepID=A0ABN9N0R0_9MYCO|nr:nuclear transport factor 2 family protein [Mycolicibacter sp. MU0083]CAJ1498419.1 nuclear transport factor 2 family protein [Mycolicibacter sp. MU0083]
MPSDTALAGLQRDVRYLLDRTQILDCVARHARGCDRHDIDLITSAYHDDGVDEHGNDVNTGPQYGAWANATHAQTSLVHTHNITTHTCEIDGDTAHAESYVLVILIGIDGKTAQFITGRYIDRLERREGQWRIAVRRSTVEGMFTADARVLGSEFFTQKGYLVGTRDREDLSYARPLRMDQPAPARWATQIRR